MHKYTREQAIVALDGTMTGLTSACYNYNYVPCYWVKQIPIDPHDIKASVKQHWQERDPKLKHIKIVNFEYIKQERWRETLQDLFENWLGAKIFHGTVQREVPEECEFFINQLIAHWEDRLLRDIFHEKFQIYQFSFDEYYDNQALLFTNEVISFYLYFSGWD